MEINKLDPKLIAEKIYYQWLMNEVSPTGILSVVADSFDFWAVVEKVLPALKDDIMKRDGKLVIRPDSSDPVEVLCGKFYHTLDTEPETFEAWKEWVADEVDDRFKSNLIAEDPHCSETTMWKSDKYGYFKVIYEPELNRHDKQYYYVDNMGDDVEYCDFIELSPTAEDKGLIQCLYETFGGTLNDKGYIMLDSHIGAIYGDSITLERQKQIIDRLIEKGFVPSVVLGIGSFTYQYVTRDTHGSAMKATDIQKGEGNHTPIFKDPKTDSSKKSAKGLLMVVKNKDNSNLELIDDVTPDLEDSTINQLVPVFKDGKLLRETNLAEIRSRIKYN